MRLCFVALVGALFCSQSLAHEMTPTYFELRPSYMDGIMVTTFKFFNRREDVSYYELSAFDKDWNPIPFAASSRLLNIGYQERATFEMYFRDSDFNDVEYICTLSKIVKGEIRSSIVSSRICSKRKEIE